MCVFLKNILMLWPEAAVILTYMCLNFVCLQSNLRTTKHQEWERLKPQNLSCYELETLIKQIPLLVCKFVDLFSDDRSIIFCSYEGEVRQLLSDSVFCERDGIFFPSLSFLTYPFVSGEVSVQGLVHTGIVLHQMGIRLSDVHTFCLELLHWNHLTVCMPIKSLRLPDNLLFIKTTHF